MTIGDGSNLPDELDEPRDKARSVLGILRAANLHPGFGFDQDEAEELWGQRLSRYDLDALLEAADEWVTSPANKDFPTLAEFDTLASACQRRLAAERGGTARVAGGQCPQCGDSDENRTGGWVTTDPGGPGIPSTVRPCSLCRPESAELHREGHHMPHSGQCPCRSDLCTRQGRRRKTARAR